MKRIGRAWWFGAFMLALGLAAFFNSPCFRLEKVVVKGNSVLSDAEVVALTGLRPGINLLKIRTGSLEAALERHPRIKRAGVRRLFPGELLIELEERVAVALLEYGGGLLEISGDSMVLGVAGAGAGDALPLVRGGRFSLQDPPSGELGQTLRFLEAMGDMRGLVAEFTLDGNGQACLLLRDGTPVYLGDAGEAARSALPVLTSILRDLEDRGVKPEYIDLRYKGQPVVKVKGK